MRRTKRVGSKLPASTGNTLLFLARPKARLLVINGEAFALCGKEHRLLSEAVYRTLAERSWISQERVIEDELAEAKITRSGYEAARKVAASRSRFIQLRLFEEEEKVETLQLNLGFEV
jgi:hypothetical protein